MEKITDAVGREKVDHEAPKRSSCMGWAFPFGQAIITAYHGHAKENACKEVFAEVSFHWIYCLEMYSLPQYFQGKEACKTCCRKESFIFASLVTKKVLVLK